MLKVNSTILPTEFDILVMHAMGVRNLEYHKIKRNFDLAIKTLKSKLTNFNFLMMNTWLRFEELVPKVLYRN